MNITLENTSSTTAVITVNIQKDDYQANVTKAIKEFCKKAEIKGFRKGYVPFGMANKIYGTQAKHEQVNKLLGEKLFGYIDENKIKILGEPLSHEGSEPQDIEAQDDFTFQFDVALRPEINITLSDKDKLPYYDIAVEDKQVDDQIEAIKRQAGKHTQTDEYTEGDILRGLLAELAEDGTPKEGGIQVEKASLMPNYFKAEAQKKIFKKAKKNDVITFSPSEAYEGNDTEIAALLHIDKEEVKNHAGKFTFQVDEISHFQPAEVNQELFDQIFGKDEVKTEDEFRNKIKEHIQNQHVQDSDYKLMLDIRAYAEDKAKDVEMPTTILRRIIEANNSDKDKEYIDKNFDLSVKELKWQIIKDTLADAQGVKVDQKEIEQGAADTIRYQFAQYGMSNVPEEYIEQCAKDLLQKREQVNQIVENIIDHKLTTALKNVVTLDHKAVTTEEFQKLFNDNAEK